MQWAICILAKFLKRKLVDEIVYQSKLDATKHQRYIIEMDWSIYVRILKKVDDNEKACIWLSWYRDVSMPKDRLITIKIDAIIISVQKERDNWKFLFSSEKKTYVNSIWNSLPYKTSYCTKLSSRR